MHFREVQKQSRQHSIRNAIQQHAIMNLSKTHALSLLVAGSMRFQNGGINQELCVMLSKELLKKNGPMNKEDIVDQVMKERYLKKNTIL